MQYLSAAFTAVISFAGGAAAGWYFLIAPADGPKGVFDSSNFEILLICGLIAGILGAIMGFFACSLIERSQKSQY
ncbi:MAG: hypothetical protein IT342_08615 [Candidatus Melainabacteria bacterium]|nr:hypothetical protein [Candidatus Melainabacteria bacterium]